MRAVLARVPPTVADRPLAVRQRVLADHNPYVTGKSGDAIRAAVFLPPGYPRDAVHRGWLGLLVGALLIVVWTSRDPVSRRPGRWSSPG